MKERTMRYMSRQRHGTPAPITLRIADACRITGIGRSKFYELIKAGEIEVIKVGAITLVPMSAIQALLERGRPGTAGHPQGKLAEMMHPLLATAILAASIAGMSESVRRELSSKDESTRTKAEDCVVERIIAVLFGQHDESLEAA